MVPRSGVLFLRRQKQVRSLLALHSAMSGTEVSADSADEISQSVADNPLLFVDGAGDTVFGRSAAYTWALNGRRHTAHSQTDTCIGV